MVTTRSSLGGRSPSPAAGNIDATTTSKKKNSDDAILSTEDDDDNDEQQPTLADVLPLIQEYLNRPVCSRERLPH